MNLQQLCDNRTPMTVRCVPLSDRHGRDVIAVIAKMTYSVTPSGAALIAVRPSPIRMSDERLSDDPWSSIRFPGDIVDEKPGTDILLIGSAYPPPDSVATEMDVSLRVERGTGTLEKALRVYGTRVYYKSLLGVAPGPAAQLKPTPLIYELAFGGRDESAGAFLIERKNPAGTGFAADPARLIGQRAAVIEDPRAAIPSRAPAGFGPIPASWSPRAELHGTLDEAWQRERAPVRPVDFNPRANCCAAPDLWSEEPLTGDEPVLILGATPEGSWVFQLPRYAPRFLATVRGVEIEIPTHLDTYLIDADTGRVELVWRAAVPVPKPIGLLDAILVVGDRPLPSPLEEDLRRREQEKRPS